MGKVNTDQLAGRYPGLISPVGLDLWDIFGELLSSTLCTLYYLPASSGSKEQRTKLMYPEYRVLSSTEY